MKLVVIIIIILNMEVDVITMSITVAEWQMIIGGYGAGFKDYNFKIINTPNRDYEAGGDNYKRKVWTFCTEVLKLVVIFQMTMNLELGVTTIEKKIWSC